MKTQPQSETSAEAMTREVWDVPIRVRLLPYVAFSHWLDEELDN